MKYTCHHAEKWIYANIDLAEEKLENHSKVLIVIAGASSSGKSFLSSSLSHEFQRRGKRCMTFSLDQYNYGLSGIIPNKVNLNYFNSSITNIEEISKKIKEIILDIPFESKYDDAAIEKIRGALVNLLPQNQLEKFLKGLSDEWHKLNFDEPTVYNLKEAAADIVKLFNSETIEAKNYSKIYSERIPSYKALNGNDYDVIIVEGIYALNEEFLSGVTQLEPITNFIEGNPKTLFLRRIIRDKKDTSASSVFTVDLYFKYILDSYSKTILPSKNAADVVLENDFSFSELRTGDLYTTRDTFPIQNDTGIAYLKENSIIEDVSYQKDFYFTVPGEKQENQNLLRFRERSFDGGKTYVPGSLVHKGAPKFRMDSKIIRPVNVLLNENEIQQVWPTNDAALFAFLNNGFQLQKAEEKIKTKIKYKNQSFSIYEVRGKQAYIEIGHDDDSKIVDEVKNIVK